MNRAVAMLKNPKVRAILVVIIVALTLGIFAYYLATHPDIIPLILGIHPAALGLMTFAYIGTILANAFVLSASLRMIGKKVNFSENVSLTGYSSVVNFFGPLQSGPGFRAAYLKKRHNVSISKFFYTTLVFYGFFALINTGILLVASLLRAPESLAPLLSVGVSLMVVALGLILYRLVPRVRQVVQAITLRDMNFWLIGLGAVALSLCTAAAYHVELLHIDPTVGFGNTLVYAATANLALFVSLTPGAIGFRESFLLLAEQLHQIPANVVLAASIIDRAFYVIFLLVMFLLLVGFGVRSKLVSNKRS
jgi:uncharacterized membrane protein YbhN (UPF0104 family)